MKARSLKCGFLILSLFVSTFLLFSQIEEDSASVEINLNNKYRYPISFGFEFKNMSAVNGLEGIGLGTDFKGEYSLTDISLLTRLPLQRASFLQPMVQLGLITTNYIGTPVAEDEGPNPAQFDNTQLYGLLGMDFSNKVSKEFEIGGRIALGAGMGLYPELADETVAQYNLLATVGAKAGLNLSYNLNIEFQPTLMYSFPVLPDENRFQGLTFGLGISGSYRTGIDPDAPQAKVRSIRFEEPQIRSLFAAMQSYYIDHPVGTVKIVNTEKFAINNVEVSFFQAGYMDSATQSATITEIGAGEEVEVDILALLNENVFATEGITPLTGEIQVSYNSQGRIGNQSQPVTYDLHDKEAMTWDDDRKVAAFITPSDAALRNYVSYIRQTCRDVTRAGYSDKIQVAMQIFYALDELGILYQLDPTSPFDAAQENPLIVDAVSLPRNTLIRGTGDCDDLTVLFTAMIEAAGMESAFITIPGHIYAAFNTGVSARDYQMIHPDKAMTIPIEGELWIPVEITMIGSEDFSTAWRVGIEEFASVANPDDRTIHFSREAQELFRPVGLKEQDLGLQYGDKSRIVNAFSDDIDAVVDSVIDEFNTAAKEKGNKGSYNKLGIVCAQFGEYSLAEKAFNNALSLDRNYTSPKINLGNVYYMKGEFQNALRLLHGVEQAMNESGKNTSSSYSAVLLNLSRCYYEIENYDKSADYSERLASIDPELAAQYSYLASSDGSTRASEVSGFRNVQFSDED
ncbi:MAG: hypothetical protein JEY99_11405 [Spirochaetales bacterium]|nr:hypothetical protein [Spirochaetales bacterium]